MSKKWTAVMVLLGLTSLQSCRRRAFSPAEREVERAKKAVYEVERAGAQNRGAVRVEAVRHRPAKVMLERASRSQGGQSDRRETLIPRAGIVLQG